MSLKEEDIGQGKTNVTWFFCVFLWNCIASGLNIAEVTNAMILRQAPFYLNLQ